MSSQKTERPSAKLWLVSSPPEADSKAQETRGTRELVPRPRMPPRPSQPSLRTPALDDCELLAAMRAADANAATAFHDRVRPQVDRTVARLLGHRDADHEDLVQLAIIELVYTIDSYRGDCSLDAWTSTLTARVVYKQIRQRRLERRVFGAVDPEDILARSPPSIDREAIARNTMLRVRRHLETLEANKAWTFLLHDVCGYDLQEIAHITSVSVSAAQTRLVRGRRELHERIAADPELANRIEQLDGTS
jgi:RNA polymerase sigma-70 factor, ECF subfamily